MSPVQMVVKSNSRAKLKKSLFKRRHHLDRVLMNPPFERGQDVAHVRHAFGMLKPGGRLVAIMADSAAFRNGFSEWLDDVGGTSKPMPGAFDCVDAFRRTGVNVQLVTIDKPVCV